MAFIVSVSLEREGAGSQLDVWLTTRASADIATARKIRIPPVIL
jgi:hypothetical protein